MVLGYRQIKNFHVSKAEIDS